MCIARRKLAEASLESLARWLSQQKTSLAALLEDDGSIRSAEELVAACEGSGLGRLSAEAILKTGVKRASEIDLRIRRLRNGVFPEWLARRDDFRRYFPPRCDLEAEMRGRADARRVGSYVAPIIGVSELSREKIAELGRRVILTELDPNQLLPETFAAADARLSKVEAIVAADRVVVFRGSIVRRRSPTCEDDDDTSIATREGHTKDEFGERCGPGAVLPRSWTVAACRRDADAAKPRAHAKTGALLVSVPTALVLRLRMAQVRDDHDRVVALLRTATLCQRLRAPQLDDLARRSDYVLVARRHLLTSDCLIFRTGDRPADTRVDPTMVRPLDAHTKAQDHLDHLVYATDASSSSEEDEDDVSDASSIVGENSSSVPHTTARRAEQFLWILLRGEVALTRTLRSRHDLQLGRLKGGDAFGEDALRTWLREGHLPLSHLQPTRAYTALAKLPQQPRDDDDDDECVELLRVPLVAAVRCLDHSDLRSHVRAMEPLYADVDDLRRHRAADAHLETYIDDLVAGAIGAKYKKRLLAANQKRPRTLLPLAHKSLVTVGMDDPRHTTLAALADFRRTRRHHHHRKLQPLTASS